MGKLFILSFSPCLRPFHLILISTRFLHTLKVDDDHRLIFNHGWGRCWMGLRSITWESLFQKPEHWRRFCVPPGETRCSRNSSPHDGPGNWKTADHRWWESGKAWSLSPQRPRLGKARACWPSRIYWRNSLWHIDPAGNQLGSPSPRDYAPWPPRPTLSSGLWRS